MSDLFSIHRFGKLLHLQLRTHIIPLLVAVGLYFVAFGCFHLLVFNTVEDLTLLAILNAVVMLGALCAFPVVCAVLTSRCFRAYHHRSQASAIMMLPCSRLEQFTVPFLLYVILIPVILGIGSLFAERAIMMHCIELLNEASIANGAPAQGNPFVLSTAELIKGITTSSAWLSIFSVQSVFFAGAIWFKSKHLLKTIGLWICLLIGISILSSIFDNFIPEMFGSLFEKVNANAPSANEDRDLFNVLSNLAVLIIMTGLAGFKFYRHKLP